MQIDNESEWQRHRDAFRELASEYNQTERSLSSQLILLGTVLLTISGVLIGEIADSLSLYEKIFAIGSIATVAVSIAAGIYNYFVAMDFFESWARTENKIANLYRSQARPKDLVDDALNLYDKLPEKPAGIWVRIQVKFLAATLFCYVAVAILALLVE